MAQMHSFCIAEPLRSHKVKTLVPIEFCMEGTDSFLPKVAVDVEPYPPHIATGTHLDISADVELAKAIEAGSKLELKLKKVGIIDITIPCLDVSI